MAVHEPQIGPPPPALERPAARAAGAPASTWRRFGVPGSELAALVEAADWSAGPLGDPQTWPQSLRTAVGICLSSRFPILLWWGPELVMIYNDAYRPMLGETKHPRALGAPGREVWTEIWDVIGPMLEQVMAGGGATWSADQLLVLDRNGYPEECYFTFSYSPITDESGGVGGVFCAVTETTEQVVGERRLATLAEMAGLMGAPSRERRRAHGGGDPARQRRRPPRRSWCSTPRPRVTAARSPSSSSSSCPSLSAGTRARVADLVRQASGTGRASTVPADGEAAGSRRPRLARLPRGGAAGPARGRGAAVIVLGESVHRPWDPSLEAYATLCATHVAAALADVRAARRGASPPPGPRRARRGQERLLHQPQPRAAHPAHPHRRPGAGGPRRRPTTPRQRQRLELVERNTKRLARMVDAMLDFGRIEAGGLAPRLEDVDVSTGSPQGLAESFRPAVERAGLAFSHDCGDGVEARLDRDMLERIVLNLLANAVKYTPEGSVDARRAGGRRRRRDLGARHRSRHPSG